MDLRQDIKIDISLLINYAHGILEANLAEKVKHAIQADKILQMEYLGVLQLIKDYPDDDVEELIEKFAHESINQRSLPSQKIQHNNEKLFYLLKGSKRAWIAVAALVIVIAGVFYFMREKDDVVQLAMEDSLSGYNPGLSTVRRESNSDIDSIFSYGNYSDFIEHAIPKLKENLTAAERKALNINICKSYIQLKQPNNAILFYQSLPDADKKDCYLQYQSALAYTIVNEITHAIPLFKEVINEQCFPADKNSEVWLERIN
jgi:hypothetical protein